MEYSATTGRLGLGLLGLEVKALGLGALLARDRHNQLFLGLGRQRVDPKWFDERSIASISGITAATLWSTALARNVGGRKNLAEFQGTDGWALTRARAWLPGKYHLGICIRNPVFIDEEGYPHFIRFRLFLFLYFLL